MKISNPKKIFLISQLSAFIVSSNGFQCMRPSNLRPPTIRSDILKASPEDEAFDPLLSPHAYPNGTDENKEKENSTENDEDDDDWSPLKMKSVKDDFDGASKKDYGVSKSTFTRSWSAVSATSNSNVVGEITTQTSKNEEVKVEIFDPLISPHAYAKGTNNAPIQPKQYMKKEIVGVLLIDHGSKRSSSNLRLEKLRDIYQDRSPAHYSVKAAHMEIAEPSIQHQIREFCNEGVKKIVCHPYFLSPGRHVLEDIPELIEEAVEAMKKEGIEDLEVLTTDPVGSKLDLMVGLIATMVDDTLGVAEDNGFDSGYVEKDKGSLGGFFGEIQRMLDEQL